MSLSRFLDLQTIELVNPMKYVQKLRGYDRYTVAMQLFCGRSAFYISADDDTGADVNIREDGDGDCRDDIC